ncbi:MAG: NUDIX domain-containing protein [Bacteroidetes bacterium]|nr:NUDIX domain-containing protein [Bacteroidota bacterium]
MISVRVYGIVVTEDAKVVLSDEYIRGGFYTKFPGGGLELGEGTRDCLQRELMEEMQLKTSIGKHIYTTDFYQQSAFNNAHQILSIYYFAHPMESFKIDFKEKPFDFLPEQISDPNGTAESFRLIPLTDLREEMVTLPIDKIVVKMIRGLNV